MLARYESEEGQKWIKSLENVIYDNSPIKQHLENALEFVQKFIRREMRILYGGMAIDFALREKGKKLYEDNAIPDYDFYSPEHYLDAYTIARELHNKGMPNVQVITAVHQTTLRVRVDFEVVADISYMPPPVFKTVEKQSLKTADGLKFVHPHFQMIDQHRSLSFPLEHFPMAPVFKRWKKDMTRFNMLYEEYPVKVSGNDLIETKDAPLMEKTVWKPQKKYCLLGYGALCYWMTEARKKGYEGPGSALVYDEKDNSFLIPNGEKRYVVYATYTENIKPTYHGLIGWIPPRFLEKHEEIWLTANTRFTAKNVGEFWIAGLQHCLMYFMYLYMFHNHSTWAYRVAFDMAKWGCEKKFADFVPNANELFGEDDVSENYLWHRENFKKKIKDKITPDNIYFEDKPKNIPFDPPKFEYTAEMFNQTGDKIVDDPIAK